MKKIVSKGKSIKSGKSEGPKGKVIGYTPKGATGMADSMKGPKFLELNYKGYTWCP